MALPGVLAVADAVTALIFPFAAFSLLYQLPPLRQLITFGLCSTSTYTILVAVATMVLEGKALVYVLPAIIMFMSSFTVMLLLNSAVAT